MRVVIAQMKHETNTFSPMPTPLANFSRGAGMPKEGAAAIAANKGTGTAIGAFIDAAERAGAEYAVPIAASAWPSGPVDDDAFEFIAERIVAAVARGCDAVLLDLHGAMVTRSHDDAEGELLRRVRGVAPDLPIGVALDMHCNLSAAMARAATTIAGYQTYPHIDMHETGLRAAAPIFGALRGEIAPTLRCGFRPMLPHVMRQSSLDAPNREIQARARAIEANGALAASLFVGFPHADVPAAGVAAAVVTDGDAAQAEAWCDELLELAWRDRAAWVYVPQPLETSLREARDFGRGAGPVVLLDHYDNCSSGGTMDTTTVLREVLAAGLDDVVAFAIFDPDAVQAMRAAGVGSRIEIELGGKLEMPALGLKGEPLKVGGRVATIVDGRYRNEGPMGRGESIDMGPTAVLDTGKVRIVVISKRVEPSDIACFRAVGIEPERASYLLLKSRVHWRAGLGSIARGVVECAGSGVCTSDYRELKFTKLGRPVYPLALDAAASGRAASEVVGERDRAVS